MEKDDHRTVRRQVAILLYAEDAGLAQECHWLNPAEIPTEAAFRFRKLDKREQAQWLVQAEQKGGGGGGIVSKLLPGWLKGPGPAAAGSSSSSSSSSSRPGAKAKAKASPGLNTGGAGGVAPAPAAPPIVVPAVAEMREAVRSGSLFLYGRVTWSEKHSTWMAEHYASKGAGRVRQRRPELCFTKCLDPYMMSFHKGNFHARSCLEPAYKTLKELERSLRAKEQTGAWA